MMNLNEDSYKAANKQDYKQNTTREQTLHPSKLKTVSTSNLNVLDNSSTTTSTKNYFGGSAQRNILPSIQTIPPSDNSETFDEYSRVSDHIQISSNVTTSTESFNEDSFLNTCSKKNPELKSFFNISNDPLLQKEELKLRNIQYKKLLNSFFNLVSSISTIDYDFISTKKTFQQNFFKKSFSLDFSFFKKHENLLENYYENAAYVQNQSVFSHLFLKSLIERNTKLLGDIHNQFLKNFFHKKLLKTFVDNKQSNGFSNYYNSVTPSRNDSHKTTHEKQRSSLETNKRHMNTEKKSYETKIVIYSRHHSDNKKHKRRDKKNSHKTHSDSSDLSDLISVRSYKRPSLSYTRDSLRSSRFKKSHMSRSSSSKSLRSIFDSHNMRLNKKPLSQIGRINHQVGTVLRVTFLVSMISATLGVVFSVLGFVEMEGWNNTKKLAFKIIGPTLLMSTLVAWLVGGMFWWLWRNEWRKEKQELEMKSRVKLHALALKLLKNSQSNMASSSSFLPSDDRLQKELMAKVRRNSSLKPR